MPLRWVEVWISSRKKQWNTQGRTAYQSTTMTTHGMVPLISSSFNFASRQRGRGTRRIQYWAQCTISDAPLFRLVCSKKLYFLSRITCEHPSLMVYTKYLYPDKLKSYSVMVGTTQLSIQMEHITLLEGCLIE